MASTHEVGNQVPPLYGHDVVGGDLALREAVTRHGVDGPAPQLRALGLLAGSEQAELWANQANTYEPELHTNDRYGNRLDEVSFHLAWHELMNVAVSHGLHGAPRADVRADAHVQRAAGFFTWSQVESGHGCPISMTYAVLPALRRQPDLAAVYEPGLTSTSYDPELRDPASKRGLLAGMGMTEKQGGSDVRANTTRAELSSDGTWRLPRPGGVPAGASWLMKSSLTTSAIAASSSAGKTSSNTRRATAWLTDSLACHLLAT